MGQCQCHNSHQRVGNKGNIVLEHFVHVKNNTCISSAAERMWTRDGERVRVGEGSSLTADEVELDDLRLADAIAQNDLTRLRLIDSEGHSMMREQRSYSNGGRGR